MPTRFRRAALAVLATLLFASLPGFAQNVRTRPAEQDREQSRDNDQQAQQGRGPEHDDPAARAQWFMRGRRVRGQSSAELRYRAIQQKMALRRQRAAQSAIRPDATTTATTTTSGGPVIDGAVAGGTGPAWTNLGPAPIITDPCIPQCFQSYGSVTGRVTSIAVDQGDTTGNTVYIGGAYGGVWKSTNAAAADPTTVAWTPITEDQPTLATGAIAIKPGNSSVILVGTGEGDNGADNYYGVGILRSTDGGASWSVIGSADGGVHPFKGLAFSRIAFSTDNPNVVVATTTADNALSLGITACSGTPSSSCTTRGIFYSQDAGATWSYASVKDGATFLDQGSAHSVVYSAAEHKFFAVYRFHGVYTSSDAINWTRTTVQPGALAIASCPATPVNQNCPIYRGELAVRPGTTDELYLWYVTANDGDEGIWKTTDGGATWTQLSETGMGLCGGSDESVCTLGTSESVGQGFFNLYLAAVPNGTGTDLYASAVNINKLPSGATTWLNLTHVYGCSSQPSGSGALAHVHPDQHGISFSVANPQVIYFGNDGGIYRTINSAGLNTGSCTGHNPFDNLNGTMGSLAQFNTFSQHPTDASVFLGGTQDNGSPSINSGSAGANGKTWLEVNVGDGGFTDIDTSNPNIWYTANTDVSIQRCTGGTACGQDNSNTSPQFLPDISNSNVGGDTGDFYTPYMLDPNSTNLMLVGTCRIWRGPGDASGVFTALSPLSSGATSGTCTSSNDLIRSIAAGGPNSGGSQVIYFGTLGDMALSIPSKIWFTTNAAGGPSTWSQGNIASSFFPITDIFIDPTVAGGTTAYATVMGFGVGHVFKTTDGGANWTNISGNLPDAPANTVLLDPLDHTIIYAGTDVGVFMSNNNGASWSEYGSRLPNSTVMKLRAFNGGTNATRFLRAVTYGRGAWQVPLASVPLTATPGITSLSPTNTNQGSAQFTLTVNGSSFVSGATVQWNGVARTTVFVNATQLTATIPATDVTNAGTAQVTVANPGPCSASCVSGGSTFTINAVANSPVPVLSNISPGTAAAGGAAFTLTVTGSGFASNSVVQWDSAALTTAFVSSSKLTAAVPAGNIAAAGSHSVNVFSPAPGGGTSGSAAFTVTATAFPTLAFAQARYWPHVITGGGFVTKMTVSNLKGTANSVIVYLLPNSGATASNVITSSATLPPGGTLRLSTDESARFGAASFQTAIVNSQDTVAVNLFFELENNSGTVINTIGFNDQAPMTDMTIPVELQSPGRTIGISFLNPSSSATANVTLQLLDGNGNVVATAAPDCTGLVTPCSVMAAQAIAPFGHVFFDVFTIPSFVTAVGSSDFIGSITIAASSPVTAMALEDDLGPFSALPPVTGRAK